MPHAYEPGGRRFESCRAHHRIKYLRSVVAAIWIFWSLHRDHLRVGPLCEPVCGIPRISTPKVRATTLSEECYRSRTRPIGQSLQIIVDPRKSLNKSPYSFFDRVFLQHR